MATAVADSDHIAYIKRHLEDQEWRMDNLYVVKDKFGMVVPFVRNESQMRLWRAMWFLNVILKDRQRGFSTLIAIFILDRCLWNSNTAAGIIDITLLDAQKKLEKIKFAYDNLPEWIKMLRPLARGGDNKNSMAWENGSKVEVGTSHRGGTLEILHVSEFGKIAARTPERAREIRTGALNTLAPGNFAFIESTAEGEGGDFHDMTKEARRMAEECLPLTELDFKFHFFSWLEGNENEMDPQGVKIAEKWQKYFDDLEKELKVEISARKRAWYVKKEVTQKEDMHREFPSTPDEAFQASVEGAYLAQIVKELKANKQITIVPHDPAYPVQSAWDFGVDDLMTIWFHQRIALQDRFIGFMYGDGKDVLYYWREMLKKPYIWGYHFLPHDAGSRRIGTAEEGDALPRTLEQIMNQAGMKNTRIVARITNKATAIQESKIFLPKVFIDSENCADGIKFLSNFKRDWNDKLGLWHDSPRKDINMHGYDSFETMVRGLNTYGAFDNSVPVTPRRDATNWRVA